MSTCAQCYGSGRVYTTGRSTPCPRCEPESAAADGAPTCRVCGSVLVKWPGVRGWVCTRCDPSYRRNHARLLRESLRTGPTTEGWLLFTGAPAGAERSEGG